MYLAKQLRAVYVKVERPQRAVDLMAYQNILEVADDYSGWVISDRHVAISEPIYGTILRGGYDLRPEDITRCYTRIGAIVHCRPPTPAVLSTVGDRPQMEGVIENSDRIIEAYDELFESIHLGQELLVKSYDFTKDSRDDLIDWLKQYRYH